MKLSLFAILAVGCGGATLSAADQESIARDGIEIAVCQQQARDCKADAGDAAAQRCWPVYDACMTSAGLRDGGSHD